MNKRASLLIVALWLVASPAGADEPALPNLVSVVPTNVVVVEPDSDEPDSDDPEATPTLRFGVSLFNRGQYPLDLLVVPASADDVIANHREILQCDTFAGPVCVSRASAGAAGFDPWTGRFRIDAVMSYTLVPVGPEGLPDFEAEPIAETLAGMDCLGDFDTDSQNTGQAQDQPLYASTITLGCATETRQGISPGFGMILPHAQIEMGDVPAGVYGLVVTIDPTGRFLESSDNDNRSWAVIDLGDVCDEGVVSVLETGAS